MNNLPAYLYTPDRESSPPDHDIREPEPACDDDCRRCIVCQRLCAEGDTCSPECAAEYMEGIREQSRDAVRERFMDTICDIAGVRRQEAKAEGPA